MGENDLILARKCMELISCCLEILACEFRYFLGNLRVKALGRIEAGSDGGSAESKLFQRVNRKWKRLCTY